MSEPDPATTAPFGIESDDDITVAALDAMRAHSRSHDDDDFVSLCCIQAATRAARPLIEAEAREAERQRIRQVVDKHEQECPCDQFALCSRLVADLLDGDGDA